ncbi:MAG: hypothetical protein OXT67_03355 [Zetaproteobacteria bacterium]|nr:hypothetical protein [Zetaproteobacteria bacterium]
MIKQKYLSLFVFTTSVWLTFMASSVAVAGPFFDFFANIPAKKEHKVVTVFDWDDTLFPTTAFLQHGGGELSFTERVLKLSSTEKEQLRKLDRLATSLVNKAALQGEVYLITNADKSWVRKSGQVLLPQLWQLLLQLEIPIISARKSGLQSFPNAPHQWKAPVFVESIMLGDTQAADLVSLGDKDGDRDAAHELQISQPTVNKVKTVKLSENPSLEQLIAQHKYLHFVMSAMYTQTSGFDVDMDDLLHGEVSTPELQDIRHRKQHVQQAMLADQAEFERLSQDLGTELSAEERQQLRTSTQNAFQLNLKLQQEAYRKLSQEEKEAVFASFMRTHTP